MLRSLSNGLKIEKMVKNNMNEKNEENKVIKQYLIKNGTIYAYSTLYRTYIKVWSTLGYPKEELNEMRNAFIICN